METEEPQREASSSSSVGKEHDVNEDDRFVCYGMVSIVSGR